MRADARLVTTSWLAMLLACGPSPDRTDTAASAGAEAAGHCDAPVVVAELSPALYEASGISRDPRREDLYWAHNDSGNAAELFALDSEGNIGAAVAIEGAKDRDWEDIAVGPCGSSECLYLADIGDNFAVHDQVAVHRLPLPDLPVQAGQILDAEASWALVYPGGARDAESLVIDAERDELLIVTKGREGYVELYAVGLDELERGAGPHVLRRIGPLPVPIGAHSAQYLTAADLSPDGSRLAVRSYMTLFEFPWEGSAAFDSLATPLASTLLPALEAQGEGLAWSNDGETVVLVSEGRSGRLPSMSSIRCPLAEGPTDAGSSSPRP